MEFPVLDKSTLLYEIEYNILHVNKVSSTQRAHI